MDYNPTDIILSLFFSLLVLGVVFYSCKKALEKTHFYESCCTVRSDEDKEFAHQFNI
jgi:hypothetical protein